MAEIALTPVSYLVLGEVARRGSATPYDLKVSVAESVGNFWSFPHAQLYKEPPRLAAAGLLAEEREAGGRRRRIFRITDAGRRSLASWLSSVDSGRTELRDPGLLKLAFSDLGRPGDVVRLARAQAAAHRAHLEVYRTLAALPADAMVWSLRRTLDLGLAYERLAAEFWERLAADPLAAGPVLAPTAAPQADPAQPAGDTRDTRGDTRGAEAAGGSAGDAVAPPGAQVVPDDVAAEGGGVG
ncbi:helix-turn-helix transcriptional regulator [Frankia sp. QA3]|uniref:helix-turn-helix transcriptional regulator n=1 Tax=Frankia sp. QA3 TaxID=710111 RepID=UPI000269CCA4|nr:helix-turn-helix transcriptional regulator [Frankia sp. QA3]EIV95600.1 putative transcriptional regulator [Frankia sp. QA3]